MYVFEKGECVILGGRESYALVHLLFGDWPFGPVSLVDVVRETLKVFEGLCEEGLHGAR